MEHLPSGSPEDSGTAHVVPRKGDVAYAFARERARAALFQVPVARQQLGRYVLLGTLGRGGMGIVLEAFDHALDRRVAVKVLHRDLGERQRRRLVREAQAMAKLSHPNVVQVYEVGEAEGDVFVAMELVRGRSLAAWQQQEPRPGWREVVQAYMQAGEGLAAAHAEGLVHRDFKPSNAIIDDKGRVRVLDFGLARQAEDTESSEQARTDEALELGLEEAALATPLTRTGTVLGTPAYMPLEQMRGEPADARSDQFSFCVSLYEALYGERPFDSRSLVGLMQALEARTIVPPPKGTAVPEALRKLVVRGLASDPRERWPSMEALLVELRRIAAPRRTAWWALGLTGGLAVLGVGLWQYAAVGFRCEGAEARLSGIWDEARKQQVEDAIVGTGLSYAPDTWERVEARLDEHARAWVGKHTEVCEATSVRQEQSTEVMDLRMECLRLRRIELREAVGVLAEADDTRVKKAMDLVTGLPAVSRCDDVEALRAELPPPEDPRVADRVEALRERLVHAVTLDRAGTYDEASEEGDAVVAEAEALGYAPLVAEALRARSSIREDLGRYPEAAQDAERAYVLAAEHGHDRVEAETATLLVWFVGIRQARHEAALQWGTTALALAKGYRSQPELEAHAHYVVGFVLQGKGELEEALSHYQRSLALNESALGPRHSEVGDSLNNIGMVLGLQGKPQEALVYHQRALAIAEEALGPRHPYVPAPLEGIAKAFSDQGKLEEALVYHRRAVSIWEEALGSDHPNVGRGLNGIGIILHQRGELDEALATFERSTELMTAGLGPEHPDVAQALHNIGLVLADQGKLEEALDRHQRTLAIRQEVLGPRHPDVAASLVSIGSVLRQQGKLEEALDHHRRALAIEEEVFGAGHPSIARAHYNIGVVLRQQGELEEARTHLQRSLEIAETALGSKHPHVAYPLVGLAAVEVGLHDAEAARGHAERAVEICEASEGAGSNLAGARFALAQALWGDSKQRGRARALAEQARDGLAALGVAEKEDLAEVEAWLAERRGP